MLKFLRKSCLWILLTPLVIGWAGTLSNQAVLWANHDTFPVMINPVKLQVFTGGELSKNPTTGKPEISGGLVIELPDGTLMTDPTHCVMTSKTRLNWLADIFDFHQSIESVGDLLIGVGEWSWGFAPYVWGFAVLSPLFKKQE